MIFAFVLVQKKQTKQNLSRCDCHPFKFIASRCLLTFCLCFQGDQGPSGEQGPDGFPGLPVSFYLFIYLFIFSNYGGASFVFLQFPVSVAFNWAGSEILLRSEARCNIYYSLQHAFSVQTTDPSLTQ